MVRIHLFECNNECLALLNELNFSVLCFLEEMRRGWSFAFSMYLFFPMILINWISSHLKCYFHNIFLFFVIFHPFRYNLTGVDNKAAFRKYGGNTSISQSIESIVSSNTVVRYHISGGIVWSKWRCRQLHIRCGPSISSQHTGKQSILDHSNGCHFNFRSKPKTSSREMGGKGGRMAEEWHLYVAISW